MTALDAQPSPRELGARELAGYRVLRSLARDENAEVLLGHRVVPVSPDSTDTVVQTVALKVSPASDPGWEAAMRECAALERAAGEHVVELLDLDADEESIRLIFERLPRGDLAELLRIRPRLDAGEAVTLLAPIAVTLQRMHTAGVAHRHLSPRTVLFRDDGSPTLIGFSHAELFEAGAPEVVLEQVEAVRRDRLAARALATTVLGRIAGGRARAARELHDDIERCDEELILPLLASRLFEVAAAVPVRFTADEPEVDAAAPAPRVVPVGVAIVEPGATPSGGGGASRIAATVGRLVPESVLQRAVDAVGRSPAAPIVAAAAEGFRRRWSSWTPARRRMVLAAGAAALTAGVVTAVVPGGAAATGTTSSAVAVPSGSNPSASASAEPHDVSDPALTGDDPLAAARALVTARERCLNSLSVICLDRVDEAGSGALEDDRAAIRKTQQGGELPDPLEGASGAGVPELIERLGDSALVRLGDAASASLLLVKSEAGWRIRDVIAAGRSSG